MTIPDGEEERVLDCQIDLLLHGMLASAGRRPAGATAN
jgi:hypothetical protein